MKVQISGNWEVQMDHQTGEVLNVAFRCSGIIESIHDGSFIHSTAKIGVFLPTAIMLLVLWITGIYLFAITELSKHRSKNKRLNAARFVTDQASATWFNHAYFGSTKT